MSLCYSPDALSRHCFVTLAGAVCLWVVRHPSRDRLALLRLELCFSFHPATPLGKGNTSENLKQFLAVLSFLTLSLFYNSFLHVLQGEERAPAWSQADRHASALLCRMHVSDALPLCVCMRTGVQMRVKACEGKFLTTKLRLRWLF